MDERKALQVMLTVEERRILDAAAKTKGLPTSTWMRTLALEAASLPSVVQRVEQFQRAARAVLDASEG